MENVSATTNIFFALVTVLAVGLLYWAAPKSRWLLVGVISWALFQMSLALTDFYEVQTTPPRFVLMALPPAIFIAGLFVTARGREFMDQLDITRLTILHTVRVFVELVLYFLFLAKAVPEIMTFEGRNLDNIAGLTAPLVYYYGFIKKVLPGSSLMLWNLTCLGLLMNIVVLAVLSAPSPFQQLGFDQPNIAITHFPYVWLPSVVVPIVLFAHLVAIRYFYKKNKQLPA